MKGRGTMKNVERSVIEIAPHSWLINEYNIVNMYLLEGREQALLIDCGSGYGDIPAEVRRLTNKPVKVVVTHGHPDHDGSSAQFKKVYMHPLDISLSEQTYSLNPKFRDAYVRTRLPELYPDGPIEEILATAQENGPVIRLPVEDGDVFELGGRKVEVVHTPGHTDGSICLLDDACRLLITGDTCNDTLLVSDTNCGDGLKKALKSFEKMWSLSERFDYICQGHNTIDKADKSFITDYIEAIRALLDGASGTPDTGVIFDAVAYQHNKVTVRYHIRRKSPLPLSHSMPL